MNEKYIVAVIEALGAIIKEKEDTIFFDKLEIERLRGKIEEMQKGRNNEII